MSSKVCKFFDFSVLRHDDKKCFWTDTYYSSKDEMESIYQRHGLEIVDHFAQDGLTPLLAQKVDKWNEKQFRISIKTIGYTDDNGRFCHSSILGRSLSVISDTIPSLTSNP